MGGFTGEGEYVLQNKLSGTYLDLDSANTQPGTRIQGWSLNSGVSQVWRFVQDTTTPGAFALQNVASGTFIYAPSDLADNNPPYEKALCVGGPRGPGFTPLALWGIVQSGDSYSISSWAYNAKKVLDLYGGEKKNGTLIACWNMNGSDAQKWSLQPHKKA